MAVVELFQVAALKHLWYASRPEFVVAVATLLGVLGSGLLRGVMIGAAISLVQLVHRTSRPHVALLGRIPDTCRFSDGMARRPARRYQPFHVSCRCSGQAAAEKLSCGSQSKPYVRCRVIQSIARSGHLKWLAKKN